VSCVAACIHPDPLVLTLAQSTARNTSGSPPMVMFFILGAVILAVIILTVVSKRNERKRLEAVTAALESRGLTLASVGNATPPAVALAPLPKLVSRPERTTWAAEGSIDGVDLVVLEHHYTTGSGKSRQTHNHAVVSFPVPPTWPKIDAYPENFFHKIGELFGSKDIKVDDDAFNKRFRVTGPSEDFALLLLTPEIQAQMLAWDKQFTLAVGSGRLCIVRGSHPTAEQWQTLIDTALALRLALPPELDGWVS
jgi:hypothetical protein